MAQAGLLAPLSSLLADEAVEGGVVHLFGASVSPAFRPDDDPTTFGLPDLMVRRPNPQEASVFRVRLAARPLEPWSAIVPAFAGRLPPMHSMHTGLGGRLIFLPDFFTGFSEHPNYSLEQL